jgi:hypothetical protein
MNGLTRIDRSGEEIQMPYLVTSVKDDTIMSSF